MENSAQLPNPLLELHRGQDAEMQGYDQLEIVSTFGEPQAEYAALHKSAGLMDQPFRAVLEVTGRDRLSFINGLVSNQTWDKTAKSPMPAGTWVYAFLLNLKGRIVADMNVIDLGDTTYIEMDGRLVGAIRDVFDKYLFAEQVKMRSLVGEMHQIAIYGPTAAEILQAATDTPGEFPRGQSAARIAIDSVPTIAWRDNPTGTDGLNLLVPSSDVQKVWSHLVERFGQSTELGKRPLRPVGWAAYNTSRIEAGRPLFGIDFAGVAPATAYPSKQLRQQAEEESAGPGILPAETGPLFSHAVNLSKCYIGQEIVARMHARQQIARKIVGIKMKDDALPIAGAQILDKTGNQVGVVTSSTMAPILSEAAICLGFVKKPHFEIGAELSIPAEGAMRAATVVELPFRM